MLHLLRRDARAKSAPPAKIQGISVSKWIAAAIEANDRDSWPPQVLASFGSWDDVPDLTTIRASFGQDGPRGKLSE